MYNDHKYWQDNEIKGTSKSGYFYYDKDVIINHWQNARLFNK